MLVAFGRSGAVDQVVEDVSSHTSSRMTGRIEVIARVSGRRFWTVEQKLTMLRDAFGPGGSVRSAAERHDVTSVDLSLVAGDESLQCGDLPPTVATSPEKGPQKGVRNPLAASAVRSVAQVTPAPTLTGALASSISIMSSAQVSIRT